MERFRKKEEMNYYIQKKQNLEVLKHYLSSNELLKRKFISKEEWKVRKKQEENRYSGQEGINNYIDFIRNLMRALGMGGQELKNLKNLNFNMIINHLNNENVVKALSWITETFPRDKKDFLMDWKKICMEDVGDFLLFIFLFDNFREINSVNTNSNHVFQEILSAQKFMLWSIQNFPDVKETDLILFKEFTANMEKLALKMYKKCYYYETPKNRDLKKEEGLKRLNQEKKK